MKTLLDFTLENGQRIWDGGHLKSSQAKIVRLSNFSDFKKRALWATLSPKTSMSS